jgi:dTDP-4-dehydrorhamnose 3,5-epimerase
MKIVPVSLKDSFLIRPEIYEDRRGFFFEFFNLNTFKELTGLDIRFVQDNLAGSGKNVLRGLHFQKKPYEQAKLVSVVKGEILDVIVDLRPGSPTFKQTFSVLLNDSNRLQLFIPKGFAHGYLALAPENLVFYKTDEFYRPHYDAGIRFDDPELQIDWPVDKAGLILSEKDKHLPFLKEILPANE